jgi:formate/nitrite transporter FocA (FNT family)
MYYLILGYLAKSNETFVTLYHGAPEKISQIDLSHIVGNLIPVTIGNIIGGAIFIGGAYWVIYNKRESKSNIERNIKYKKSINI